MIDTVKNSLIVVIVKMGLASKILKTAKEKGVTGGSILLGKGTIQNNVMKMLGIDETKKEIILMVVPKNITEDVSEYLSEKFEFTKKNKGIMFMLDVSKILGIKNKNIEGINKMSEKSKSNYEAVFVIVNRGDAKEVVNIATENGARGGTILNGRGSGIHENSSFFSMAIEPEKEIILLLIEKNKINNIIEVIEKTMQINEPGKGIIFTLPVEKTIGLYEGN